jgi:hypothetical protein
MVRRRQCRGRTTLSYSQVNADGEIWMTIGQMSTTCCGRLRQALSEIHGRLAQAPLQFPNLSWRIQYCLARLSGASPSI